MFIIFVILNTSQKSLITSLVFEVKKDIDQSLFSEILFLPDIKKWKKRVTSIFTIADFEMSF